MSGTSRIWLVGMMGSGKTSVGEALAARLDATFVDADREIERTAGKSIARIFAEDGEPEFRRLEAETVARLATDRELDRAVVALGGGAVLDRAVRRRIGETGRVVWLRASPETAAERLGGGDDRPLVAGLDHPARARRLADLLAARAPLYDEVAEVVVDTDARSPERIAADVHDWAERTCAVRVDLGSRGYDVRVEPGGLGGAGRRMRRAGLRASACALVHDRSLPERHTARVLAGLREAGFQPARFVLPPGEGAKWIDVVGRLLEGFAEAKLDRASPVIALGGGALTDAAGFAASIYLRGVPWVAVPTTLLGMVDAAIGGKTGVNLARGKNLAGTFHQPRLVLCDPEALATLPPDEVRSGLGEVLKYALIGPADLFERACASLEPDADLIARCARLKAEVVARDERETGGGRKVLNFGHTIGHAVEAASGFTMKHGDAVVHGMRAALRLSREKGLMDAAEHERLAAFLGRHDVPPVPAGIREEDLVEPLLRDKKFRDGRLLFVLLRGRGRPEVDVEVTRDELSAALRALLAGGRT